MTRFTPTRTHAHTHRDTSIHVPSPGTSHRLIGSHFRGCVASASGPMIARVVHPTTATAIHHPASEDSPGDVVSKRARRCILDEQPHSGVSQNTILPAPLRAKLGSAARTLYSQRQSILILTTFDPPACPALSCPARLLPGSTTSSLHVLLRAMTASPRHNSSNAITRKPACITAAALPTTNLLTDPTVSS